MNLIDQKRRFFQNVTQQPSAFSGAAVEVAPFLAIPFWPVLLEASVAELSSIPTGALRYRFVSYSSSLSVSVLIARAGRPITTDFLFCTASVTFVYYFYWAARAFWASNWAAASFAAASLAAFSFLSASASARLSASCFSYYSFRAFSFFFWASSAASLSAYFLRAASWACLAYFLSFNAFFASSSATLDDYMAAASLSSCSF